MFRRIWRRRSLAECVLLRDVLYGSPGLGQDTDMGPPLTLPFLSSAKRGQREYPAAHVMLILFPRSPGSAVSIEKKGASVKNIGGEAGRDSGGGRKGKLRGIRRNGGDGNSSTWGAPRGNLPGAKTSRAPTL